MSSDRPTLALVLAGGRGTRMGGLDKPALDVRGRRMLDIALAAVSHLGTTVVVGPHRPELPPAVIQTQESPIGSGPVAAIAAGLAAVDTPADAVVMVLASDLPYLERSAVDALIAATSLRHPVTCAVDENDRVQFLLSAWTVSELRRRLSTLHADTLDNRAVKALVAASFSTLRVPGTADADTPADLDRAREYPRLSITAARAAITNALTPMPAGTAQLIESFGAALAGPLIAHGDLPRSDVSAMDGYAVAGAGPWHIRDEIRIAGATGTLTLTDGEAARIATGAHLPAGATSVIRDEHVTVVGNPPELHELPDVPRRNDARLRGEDWSSGYTIAPAGTTITPALVSAASSGEVFDAPVRGPVRARLVITGDEIRSTGPLQRGQTRDSVGAILPHLLERSGVRCISNTHLRDTADNFESVLTAESGGNLIVIVGATGGGAADELRSALSRLGARVIVGRVASRPGGSQITAVLPDGAVVLGLPGNPYAAVTTLLTMLPTIVAALTACAPAPPTVGVIANASDVSSVATRLLPVTQLSDGRWRADPSVRTAHLAGLIGRAAFALIPEGADDDCVAELILLPT
ncbi:molybdopterin molybdotransferase [Rhodococcus sp. 27YEA15]|uniref:NTP transferase domain-containing protein n=1 Tax=Rhodococcus sp. 27YEA15 TaxID=3156259 RepID=UPI003C7BFFD9